jgi:hypothetical protein
MTAIGGGETSGWVNRPGMMRTGRLLEPVQLVVRVQPLTGREVGIRVGERVERLAGFVEGDEVGTGEREWRAEGKYEQEGQDHSTPGR